MLMRRGIFAAIELLILASALSQIPGVPITIVPLIVTIPDPVNSHLVLDFDLRIDSIVAAALDSRFVMDQFWLPWDPSANAGHEPLDSSGQARALREVRSVQPRLQIFRSREQADSVALF